MTGYEHAIGADAIALVTRNVEDDEFGAWLAERIGLPVLGLFGDQTIDALDADDIRAAGFIRRADLIPAAERALAAAHAAAASGLGMETWGPVAGALCDVLAVIGPDL